MSHVHGQFYGGDLFPIPMVPHRESHQPTIQQTMSTKSTHEILFYEKIRIPIVSTKKIIMKKWWNIWKQNSAPKFLFALALHLQQFSTFFTLPFQINHNNSNEFRFFCTLIFFVVQNEKIPSRKSLVKLYRPQNQHWIENPNSRVCFEIVPKVECTNTS